MAVGDGVIVSVTLGVTLGILMSACVLPVSGKKGSYVGNTAGACVAGAHETSRIIKRNAEAILEKDMNVILPK